MMKAALQMIRNPLDRSGILLPQKSMPIGDFCGGRFCGSRSDLAEIV
jgi:hypothetical protein